VNPTLDTDPIQAAHRQSAAFDRFHRARASTRITAELYAAAYGDAYPAEADASSSCTWDTLAATVAALRLPPGSLLADLGCGTGGVGLWLARALSARLVGIDISPVAVDLARTRTPAFLPAHRAQFRTGTLTATGLPDAAADGVVCIDVLSFAEAETPGGRTAALAEIRRILRPGGRAVLTTGRRTPASPWPHRAAAAGLLLEAETPRPGEPGNWARLYQCWTDRETDLRRELGDEATDAMLDEAARIGPTLTGRHAALVVLRRPPTPSTPAR
jgi:ubiquinone/menaquinone biosynthesis C-methylase UbiE